MSSTARADTCVEIKDSERYKTSMCKNWIKQGCCPYGSRCQFAHGEAELRARTCRPSRPPNFWMRSKKTTTQSRGGAPASALTKASAPAPMAPTLQVTAPRVAFEPPPYATLGTPAAAPSPHTASQDLAFYGTKILNFGPIDATATLAAQGWGDCLRVNQTTGKVEACTIDGGESTGCTASPPAAEEDAPPPLIEKRQASHTTSLVRRTCSFLFDNEAPSLRRRTSLESLEPTGRSTAEEKGRFNAVDELAIIDKLGSLLDQLGAPGAPPPPPAATRRLSHPRLVNKSLPSWGAAGAGRPVVA